MTIVNKFSHYCLCCLSVLFALVCSAEPPGGYNIQQLDNRNGLSNSSINNIYYDSRHLLWVATWDGLNMYDGSTFHVFNYGKENDHRSLGSNVIKQILEDREGNIWVSTVEGISRYAFKTGKFNNYFYRSGTNAKISEQEFLLAVNNSGQVYCFSNLTGLSYYDAARDSFYACNLHLPLKQVLKLAFNAENSLCILSADGRLSIFEGGPASFRKTTTVAASSPVNALYTANGKTFFTTRASELYLLERGTPRLLQYLSPGNAVASMIFYNEHYFIAWTTKGFAVLDSSFHASDFFRNNTERLQEARITALAGGDEGILWIGTDGSGILKVFPGTKFFGEVKITNDGLFYNKAIRSFCRQKDNLWIATKGSGIVSLQNFWKNYPAGYLQTGYAAPEAIENNSVYALKAGKDDWIFIGSDAKGITLYDNRKGRFFKWDEIEGAAQCPEFGSVYSIYQDEDASLWIGTSGYGLLHLSVLRNREGRPVIGFCRQFMFNDRNTGPANDIIYSLAARDSASLWVGCRYGGLCLLDKKRLVFRTFKAFSYDGSLSNNDVLSLFTDRQNRLWIGTSYGLNWIDNATAAVNKPVFNKLTVASGLPNNTIHAIEQDEEGNIWVSTNGGLAKIFSQSMQVSYFKHADGLQSNEFCDGAVWKDSSGYIFFGGTSGFNHFKPENIRRSDWMPGLLVSDLSIGEKQMRDNRFYVLSPSGEGTRHFSINRKSNYFSLAIKAVSFLNAEKCEYAYMLEGLDKNWHYSGVNGNIQYENIPPGNYTLRVRWTNGESVWTKEQPFFSLQVQQYIWLKWYALLTYALLAAVAIRQLILYRRNKTEMKHQLELEHLSRVKEEEVHENRLSFFTNIAHELQTPLTLIMGSAERVIEKNGKQNEAKEKSYFIRSIHSQASRLSYLVHQLLEFRKLELGFLKANYEYLQVSGLLHALGEAFVILGTQSRKQYSMQIRPGMTGWADKDKIEKIVFNLLSNAFKHSPKGGEIQFQGYLQDEDRNLVLLVSNSGVEFNELEIRKLFTRFYTKGSSDESWHGTGIGLAFTKQLVDMLNGTIQVYSEDHRLCFRVILPMGEGDRAGNGEPAAAASRPSYLYRAITGATQSPQETVHREINGKALVESLSGDTRKKLLVAEDEPEIRFLLKDMLQQEYVVFEAEDGQAALDMTRMMEPDLIICDVLMPNMGGLEFCNKIKNSPKTCHIPIIMLSALGSDTHQLTGYEAGADAYIAKPFHTDHLKIRIRKMLEYREKLVEFFKEGEGDSNLSGLDLTHTDKEFLIRLVAAINDNMDKEELDASFLEQTFCLSKMQLYRKMKALTGMTPGSFIRHTRLKKAAELLESTNLNVTEIFYRTGFNNQSYFFREFKKHYGCAPSEFRQKSFPG